MTTEETWLFSEDSTNTTRLILRAYQGIYALMLHDSLDFHNTVELPPAPGGGLQISRFPSSIWNLAEAPMGSKTIRGANGCEIRFVTDKPRIRLYLRSLSEEKELVHLQGNHILRTETLPMHGIQCLDINVPPQHPETEADAQCCGGFAPNVYRVVSVGGTLAYHGMDAMGGQVRPPSPNEVPRRRWLAYGSSITQAGETFCNYVNVAAQMLEVDALNLGMSGSCWIEPSIADFIASRDDWDFASFELGVNMRNSDTTNEQFAERVAYLLDTVTAEHPEKPIFLITLFRNREHHERTPSETGKDQEEKDLILRDAAARHPGQVVLLDGKDIAPDFRGFKADLLHPEPFAYARMGLNLAEMIANSAVYSSGLSCSGL